MATPYTTTPNNSFAESGLGEDPTALASNVCTSTPVGAGSAADCEIARYTGIPANSSVFVADANTSAPITDVIIGSGQTGENYIIYAGNSLASLTQIAAGTGTGCTGTTAPGVTQGAGPAPETCIIMGFSDQDIAVQSGGTGNILLTAISVNVPAPPKMDEPAPLAVLGAALAGLGLLRRHRTR